LGRAAVRKPAQEQTHNTKVVHPGKEFARPTQFFSSLLAWIIHDFCGEKEKDALKGA
jgi:hypothetical protein